MNYIRVGGIPIITPIGWRNLWSNCPSSEPWQWVDTVSAIHSSKWPCWLATRLRIPSDHTKSPTTITMITSDPKVLWFNWNLATEKTCDVQRQSIFSNFRVQFDHVVARWKHKRGIVGLIWRQNSAATRSTHRGGAGWHFTPFVGSQSCDLKPAFRVK